MASVARDLTANAASMAASMKDALADVSFLLITPNENRPPCPELVSTSATSRSSPADAHLRQREPVEGVAPGQQRAEAGERAEIMHLVDAHAAVRRGESDTRARGRPRGGPRPAAGPVPRRRRPAHAVAPSWIDQSNHRVQRPRRGARAMCPSQFVSLARALVPDRPENHRARQTAARGSPDRARPGS